MALPVGPSAGRNNIRRFLENPRASINVVLDALANEGSDLANLLSRAALSNPSSGPFVESLGIGPEDVAVPPIAPSLREKGDAAREELGPASFLLDLAAPSLMDLAGPAAVAMPVIRNVGGNPLSGFLQHNVPDPFDSIATGRRRVAQLRASVRAGAPLQLSNFKQNVRFADIQRRELDAVNRGTAVPIILGQQPVTSASLERLAARLGTPRIGSDIPNVTDEQGRLFALGSKTDVPTRGGTFAGAPEDMDELINNLISGNVTTDTIREVEAAVASPEGFKAFVQRRWPGLYSADQHGLIVLPRSTMIMLGTRVPIKQRPWILRHEIGHAMFGMRDKEAGLEFLSEFGGLDNTSMNLLLEEAERLSRIQRGPAWDYAETIVRAHDNPDEVVELYLTKEGIPANNPSEVESMVKGTAEDFGIGMDELFEANEYIEYLKEPQELVADATAHFMMDPSEANEVAPNFARMLREILVGGDPEMARRGIKVAPAVVLPFVAAGMSSLSGEPVGPIAQPTVEEQLFGQ